MNILGGALDILGSAGFGSVIGGLFGWLGKREERANMKMKYDHDVNMVTARTDAAIQTAKIGIETAKIVGMLAVEKIEATAFEQSQKSTSGIGDILKSFIRPLILGALLWQTYQVMTALETFTGGLESLPEEELLGLYRIVVLSITGLTATAVGWYFAARTSKQFDKLLDRWHPKPPAQLPPSKSDNK